LKITIDKPNGYFVQSGGAVYASGLLGGAIGLLWVISAFAQSPIMPNPQLTPGVVRTSNAAEICAKSFRTGPYRHTTSATKKQVCVEYGLTDCPHEGKMEIDHLIPLELGGLDDIKNLWPQPALPRPGFHEKDRLEGYLRKQVCAGKMSLSDAQHDISRDWWGAYIKMEGENGHR
jgi:hypothetical protein